MVDENNRAIVPEPGSEEPAPRKFLDKPPASVRANPKADAEAQVLIAHAGQWTELQNGVGKAAILSALARAGYAGEASSRNGEVWAVATVPLSGGPVTGE